MFLFKINEKIKEIIDIFFINKCVHDTFIKSNCLGENIEYVKEHIFNKNDDKLIEITKDFQFKLS